jgi:hypothetical protein
MLSCICICTYIYVYVDSILTNILMGDAITLQQQKLQSGWVRIVICTFICVCMYTSLLPCICICTYSFTAATMTDRFIYVYVCIYMVVHVYISIYTCMHIYIYLCLCYLDICICVYVSISILNLMLQLFTGESLSTTPHVLVTCSLRDRLSVVLNAMMLVRYVFIYIYVH